MLEQSLQVLLRSRGDLRFAFDVIHPSGVQETWVAGIRNFIQDEMLFGSLANGFSVLLLPDFPLIDSDLTGSDHLTGSFLGFFWIEFFDPADGAKNLLWLGRASAVRHVFRRINSEVHPVGFDAILGNANAHRQTIDGFVIFLVLDLEISDLEVCKLSSAGHVKSTGYHHATKMLPQF